MTTTTIYEYAVDSWSSFDRIVVKTTEDIIVGMLPIEFVQRGGDDSWGYVLGVMRELVNDEGCQLRLKNESGVTLDILSPTKAGEFYLCEEGQDVRHAPSSISFSAGPEYFRRGLAPKPEGSTSTRSDSKRSSVNQSRFRVGVIARDGTCLVTDADYTSCTACHIVPYSRSDVYEEILRITNYMPVFYASCGILLRDDLHHAFDRLEFSFYCKDDVIFVHFFVLNLPEARDLHGKAIGPNRFRGQTKNRPNQKLLCWHYTQCLKAHIRGFSVQ